MVLAYRCLSALPFTSCSYLKSIALLFIFIYYPIFIYFSRRKTRIIQDLFLLSPILSPFTLPFNNAPKHCSSYSPTLSFPPFSSINYPLQPLHSRLQYSSLVDISSLQNFHLPYNLPVHLSFLLPIPFSHLLTLSFHTCSEFLSLHFPSLTTSPFLRSPPLTSLSLHPLSPWLPHPATSTARGRPAASVE